MIEMHHTPVVSIEVLDASGLEALEGSVGSGCVRWLSVDHDKRGEWLDRRLHSSDYLGRPQGEADHERNGDYRANHPDDEHPRTMHGNPLLPLQRLASVT